MINIKKYPWKMRKIIERNWDQIKYLFENERFEEKKNKYLYALEGGNSHSESLIYAYSKGEYEKNEEIIFSYQGYLYKIIDMEFLGEIIIIENYQDEKIRYFYCKETDKIFAIWFIKNNFKKNSAFKYEDWWEVEDRNKLINKFIDNGQKELAVKLYERFVKDKENKDDRTKS